MSLTAAADADEDDCPPRGGSGGSGGGSRHPHRHARSVAVLSAAAVCVLILMLFYLATDSDGSPKPEADSSFSSFRTVGSRHSDVVRTGDAPSLEYSGRSAGADEIEKGETDEKKEGSSKPSRNEAPAIGAHMLSKSEDGAAEARHGNGKKKEEDSRKSEPLGKIPVADGEEQREDKRKPTSNKNGTKKDSSSLSLSSSTSTYSADDADRAVRPLWRCADSARSKLRSSGGTKFAFVHVFKAAGSTISKLFAEYSAQCRTGAARLVACTDAVYPEKGSGGGAGGGRNGTWKHCHLKHAVTRDGTYYRYDGWTNVEESGGEKYWDNVNDTFLEEELDIVGGHLKIGTLDHLTLATEGGNSNGGKRKRAKVRYSTFVRDAAEKFVSGRVFSRLKFSKDTGEKITGRTLLSEIRELLLDNYEAKKFHNKYLNYLLTPSQKRDMGGTLGEDAESVERTAELVIRNLREYNVLIGVVERMPESLELFHHVLDPDDDARKLFESYGMRNAAGNITASHASNKSPISASVLVKKLREDEKVSEALDSYVQYERRITEAAVEMHEAQYEAMKRGREKKTKKSSL